MCSSDLDLPGWDALAVALADPHDYSVLDPDDRTVLNAMDAYVHPVRALDEGLADAVAMSFSVKASFLGYAPHSLELETRSVSWRRISWERQQGNEYLVAMVLNRYLGSDPALAAARLTRLVAVGARRQPRRLQDLLEALADDDPVEARGRLDAILQGLHAGWDSEREELAQLRREGR